MVLDFQRPETFSNDSVMLLVLAPTIFTVNITALVATLGHFTWTVELTLTVGGISTVRLPNSNLAATACHHCTLMPTAIGAYLYRNNCQTVPRNTNYRENVYLNSYNSS